MYLFIFFNLKQERRTGISKLENVYTYCQRHPIEHNRQCVQIPRCPVASMILFVWSLTRLPGYLFDFIAHLFSSSTFSSSVTSLLCKRAKLALLQDFYMTFLSVKVLPPPSNQWAFSSLNPLIKWHLRRSLPWAPCIKSNPHPLPRCPAPPFLLLTLFCFPSSPLLPERLCTYLPYVSPSPEQALQEQGFCL